MHRHLPLLLAFCSHSLPAAPGSWTADAVGVTLQQRGVIAASQALRPPLSLPVGEGRITSVGWRYRLLSSTPVGLRVKLCSALRCVSLGGESGETRGFQGDAGLSELRFVYTIEGQGGVYPVLRVISNQVVVNYR